MEHNTQEMGDHQNKTGSNSHTQTRELDARTGDKRHGDMTDWGDNRKKQR